MSPEKKAEILKKEIQPLMETVFELCKKYDISCACIVGYTDRDGLCRSFKTLSVDPAVSETIAFLGNCIQDSEKTFKTIMLGEQMKALKATLSRGLVEVIKNKNDNMDNEQTDIKIPKNATVH